MPWCMYRGQQWSLSSEYSSVVTQATETTVAVSSMLLLLLYQEGVEENDNACVSWTFCGSPLLVLSFTSEWVLGSNSGCQACKHLYPLSTVLAPILLFLYDENPQLPFSWFFEI